MLKTKIKLSNGLEIVTPLSDENSEIYAVCPKCGKAFESDEVLNCFSDFFFGSASLYCVECSAQMSKQ